MTESSQRVGWGRPLGVVLALHLGLAAVPLSFDRAEEVDPEPITLTLKAPEPVAEPVEPLPEPEPMPEPEVVPEPPPEPVKPPPRQQVEAPKVASSEVVVNEPEPEIVPVPEEAPVSLEPPEEVAPEATEPVEEAPVVDEPAPDPEPAEPPAPLVDPVDWGAYESRITGALEAEKRYPRMARRMGVEGEAVVRIIIRRDGTLAQPPQLVRSSGNNLLDKEVLRMVEAAEPYAGLPEDAVIDEFELVVPVNFLLE
ncbi:energy transducer TonB [Lujinxingia vulgaris]|nr:energy transducer TonB [Lujinxingia vulgaris]